MYAYIYKYILKFNFVFALKDAAKRIKRSVSEDFSTKWDEIRQDASNEMRSRYYDYQRHLDNTAAPLVTEVDREWTRFVNEVSEYMNSMNTMYRNNEFHMRDAHEFTKYYYDIAEEVTRFVLCIIANRLKVGVRVRWFVHFYFCLCKDFK